MKIDIPACVEFSIKKLIGDGYDAYAVGGCVRDALLGVAPKDWDIATTAAPSEISAVFEAYKCLTHGADYGTITVLFDGKTVEITTFRIDGKYTDNRRPDSVRFTRSLLDDIRRRDFTINALAYRHDCGLVDYFGGREDLDNGIVRCVGDARERFKEDALRILRALRFASRLSFTIEEHTAAAIHEMKDSLRNIARERICAELSGILSASGDGAAVVLREFSDVIHAIFPGLDHCANAWDCIIRSIANTPPELALRLALLLAPPPTPAQLQQSPPAPALLPPLPQQGLRPKPPSTEARRMLHELRFGNEVIDEVTVLIDTVCADAISCDSSADQMQRISGDVQIKRLLNALGERRLRLLLHAKRALVLAGCHAEDAKIRQLREIGAAESRISEIINNGECYSLMTLNINGKDLLSIGYKPGKPLGMALRELLERVVAGNCPNERRALLDQAKDIMQIFY